MSVAQSPTTQPSPHASTPHDDKTYSSVGLTQAYEFRSFASQLAHAIMLASDEELETQVARARALRDANSVWQTAQDETRVCRGVGKPKGVTAVNDPERKASKAKRKPAVPLDQ